MGKNAESELDHLKEKLATLEEERDEARAMLRKLYDISLHATAREFYGFWSGIEDACPWITE